MLSKPLSEELAGLIAAAARRDGHYAIAYALLCIHDVMQRQQELEAEDDAQIEQIQWNITSKQGGN